MEKSTAAGPGAAQTLPRQPTPDLSHQSISLADLFDASPMATFVIDTMHVVTHWNTACEHALGVAASDVVGTNRQWMGFYANERPVLADLVLDGSHDDAVAVHYQGKYKRSSLIPGAVEAEDFFPRHGATGRWLHFTAAPLHDQSGKLVGAIETIEDITERRMAEEALRTAHESLEFTVLERTRQLQDANDRLGEDIRRQQLADAGLRRHNVELTELNEKLSMAQAQLMQSEKLASIGQLAAGVAHEINNPIGYVFSNLATLKTYMSDLFEMLAAYHDAEPHLPPAVAADLAALRARLDLAYLLQDIPSLMSESRDGIFRVRDIVRDLKDFSRIDSTLEWQWANLQRGIESTLNIVNNEVKYVADVVLDFGALPDIECLPSQINQVVLNLVVNAAHAIGPERGRISLSTGVEADGEHVWIEIGDTGSGIAAENLSRIFDPFFTTKAVGKGTGLGLALSYRIVQTHGGRIDVDSQVGKGSRFRITLPVRQQQAAEAPAQVAP